MITSHWIRSIISDSNIDEREETQQGRHDTAIQTVHKVGDIWTDGGQRICHPQLYIQVCHPALVTPIFVKQNWNYTYLNAVS